MRYCSTTKTRPLYLCTSVFYHDLRRTAYLMENLPNRERDSYSWRETAGGRVQISQPRTSATTRRTSSPNTAIRRMGRPFWVHMNLGQPNNSDLFPILRLSLA
jgi:hypothetical protein